MFVRMQCAVTTLHARVQDHTAGRSGIHATVVHREAAPTQQRAAGFPFLFVSSGDRRSRTFTHHRGMPCRYAGACVRAFRVWPAAGPLCCLRPADPGRATILFLFQCS